MRRNDDGARVFSFVAARLQVQAQVREAFLRD